MVSVANNLEWDFSLHLLLWVSKPEKNNIERFVVEKRVQCFEASGVADLSTLAQLSDELISGAPELCNYEVAHVVERDRVHRAL